MNSNVTFELSGQDWSDTDKLLVSSRELKLQSLQALAEIQEYVHFRSEASNFESSHGVEQLLRKWEGRLPHPKRDPVRVWEDVVTGRCMMMRKILEHFHTTTTTTTTTTAQPR